MVIRVLLLQLQCELGDFSKMKILILKVWLGPEILQIEFANSAQIMAMQLVLRHMRMEDLGG